MDRAAGRSCQGHSIRGYERWIGADVDYRRPYLCPCNGWCRRRGECPTSKEFRCEVYLRLHLSAFGFCSSRESVSRCCGTTTLICVCSQGAFVFTASRGDVNLRVGPPIRERVGFCPAGVAFCFGMNFPFKCVYAPRIRRDSAGDIASYYPLRCLVGCRLLCTPRCVIQAGGAVNQTNLLVARDLFTPHFPLLVAVKAVGRRSTRTCRCGEPGRYAHVSKRPERPPRAERGRAGAGRGRSRSNRRLATGGQVNARRGRGRQPKCGSAGWVVKGGSRVAARRRGSTDCGGTNRRLPTHRPQEEYEFLFRGSVFCFGSVVHFRFCCLVLREWAIRKLSKALCHLFPYGGQ